MVRLTGKDALAELNAWWAKAQRSRFPWRRIIHILKPFQDEEFNTLLSYQRWCIEDPDAVPASLVLLRADTDMRPYLRQATEATRNRVPQTRVFIVRRRDYANPTSIQRYVAEVHYPFFAAETGETIRMVFLEDLEHAGFTVRADDVNLWSFIGIMRTGYAGGNIAWREFLPWWRHPYETFRERRFVLRVERFARRYGMRVQPADLP